MVKWWSSPVVWFGVRNSPLACHSSLDSGLGSGRRAQVIWLWHCRTARSEGSSQGAPCQVVNVENLPGASDVVQSRENSLTGDGSCVWENDVEVILREENTKGGHG